MRAVTYQGAKDIQVKNVEDPRIEKRDDIIVRITSTPFAVQICTYIKEICHCAQAILLGMNQWGLLKKQVLM
jgi:hypothetical protein